MKLMNALFAVNVLA